MKYEIEKDKIFNKWIVFERHNNLLIEVYRSERKRDCQQWIKQQKNRKTRKPKKCK